LLSRKSSKPTHRSGSLARRCCASADTQRVSTATGGGTIGSSPTFNQFSTSLSASYVLDF